MYYALPMLLGLGKVSSMVGRHDGWDIGLQNREKAKFVPHDTGYRPLSLCPCLLVSS